MDYKLDAKFGLPGMVYGKVSQGYKEGGFTVRNIDLDALGGDINNPDIGFDREKVTSYEIGFKGNLLEDSLRANVALFYLDYKDIQATVVNEDGNQRIENGPTADSTGAELELTYILNRYFLSTAAIGYTDAKYGDFDNCSTVDDCSGNTLPRSSEWTGNVSLVANYPLDNGWELFSSVNYSYRSDSNIGSTEQPELELGKVEILNVQGGVRLPEYNLELQLYANNVADEKYYTSISDYTLGGIMGTSGVRYGAPRTYGARVTYQF